MNKSTLGERALLFHMLPVRAPQPSDPTQVVKIESSCSGSMWLRTVDCWSDGREGCSTRREQGALQHGALQ